MPSAEPMSTGAACDHGDMKELAPFRLDPILVERPWGGTRLAAYGKELPPGVRIGESWELADLPQHVAPTVDDPSSIILDGPYAGARLRTLMAEAAEALLGPIPPTAERRFPLLFKLLDAREHVSVQVHPHAAYVASHPEARLKTESWYVIDADPGAVLYLDVTASTTLADIEAVMGTPDIVPLLGERAAVPGAFHHVPAGLIHALGAGTFVAEVQTPSDTTFRIYDWSMEYSRAPRPMHPAESMASIQLDPEEASSLDAWSSTGVRELVSNDHYWMREHRVPDGTGNLAQTPGPSILNVTRGSIRLGDLHLGTGATAIVPAACSVSAFEGTGAIVMEMGFEA
jgi:mannose-6-phosphate isomerase